MAAVVELVVMLADGLLEEEVVGVGLFVAVEFGGRDDDLSASAKEEEGN